MKPPAQRPRKRHPVFQRFWLRGWLPSRRSHSPILLAELANVIGDDRATAIIALGADFSIELFGGSLTDVPERYIAASPAAMLPLGVLQRLIHGTNDENVPLQVSQAYANAARAVNDPVTCIVLDGVDHFDVIDPHSNAWAVTIEQLQPMIDHAASRSGGSLNEK